MAWTSDFHHRDHGGGIAARDDGGAVQDDGPPDMTGQYNTRLNEADEQAYQAWGAREAAGRPGNRNPALDTYDYDMRGFWKSGDSIAENGHAGDRFKKPNHPTFSDLSQYHGQDGHAGGHWADLGDGKWSFTASPANLKMSRPENLRRYFEDIEKGNQLIMPQHRDYGGSVDPSSGEDGAITPNNQTVNPQVQGMMQRYASMPPEKLRELAVMLGGSPQGAVISSVLRQKQMAGGAEPASAPAGVRRGGSIPRREAGGTMTMSQAMPSWSRRQETQGTAGGGATGFLHGPTPGRADAVMTSAPAGSYVIPAHVVSGAGEGNSLAGAGVMDKILRSGPMGTQMPPGHRGAGPPRPPPAYSAPKSQYAAGGDIGRPTPVALSHGEYVINPETVLRIGGGDMKRGHRILDEWVKAMTKLIIDRMKKLPGPVRSAA